MLSAMNTKLQQTIHDLEQLPENKREVMETKLSEMVSLAKIDQRISESETRGGETPSDEFFASIKAAYAR